MLPLLEELFVSSSATTMMVECWSWDLLVSVGPSSERRLVIRGNARDFRCSSTMEKENVGRSILHPDTQLTIPSSFAVIFRHSIYHLSKTTTGVCSADDIKTKKS
jgi:hypothetical protein